MIVVVLWIETVLLVMDIVSDDLPTTIYYNYEFCNGIGLWYIGGRACHCVVQLISLNRSPTVVNISTNWLPLFPN